MENTGLQGSVPASLFSLFQLQSVNMRKNKLNGTLEINSTYSDQLQLIDMHSNLIDSFIQRPGYPFQIILTSNPVCNGGGSQPYCVQTKQEATYSTPPENCSPTECSSNQISSPTCRCAYPYTGNLVFRAPSFSNLENKTTYETLHKSLELSIKNLQLPVDSVSLSNPTKNLDDYLVIHLQVFPSSQDYFNRIGVADIGSFFSARTFQPPSSFGPFVFIAEGYKYLDASWDSNKHSGGVPQLTGARYFSFEELRKWTNNFSDINDIGAGGYGKVYRGTLPNGELVAVKRAKQGSMQGALELKTEIELLSRVHHKNVVGLIGFCFDQDEQMLVYEYIPNGTLRDGLSGRIGIRLDWMRRLRIALGAARGLQYLHDLVNPPIIHRDIKSDNILLDERLNAKVADFGLSKLLGDSGKGHITTQVKGTMGYMDPEYYMTVQLTEKSDVYSFGVVLLELVTGKVPIEKGKYIVREVRTAMDKTKDMYNLQEILDPAVRSGTTPRSVEKFVDVANKCVEEGAKRPTMSDVVKEIENIMEIVGLNPNAE